MRIDELNGLRTLPRRSTENLELQPWKETHIVGGRVPRIDGYERVSGSAVYTLDLALPEMLHAAVLRCPHANAVVKNIDVLAALKMPGVRAVLTSNDEEGKIVVPYPWWVDQGPPIFVFDKHCRYAGEEVAGVAADTREQAHDAIRAIKVEYEVRPFLLNRDAALKGGANRVHESGNLVRPPDYYERGNVAAGFADADFVVEETYKTSCLIHTPLEAHVSLARWQGDRVTVWDSTQAIFESQKSLAKCLSLPLNYVRIISQFVGGSFGCKAELSKHTVLAALLARKAGRPIKLVVNREDSFLCVGNRPANTMKLKAGAKKDGSLTALQFTNTGAVGAYADLGGGSSAIANMYICPNVQITETEVYINGGKSRAFRAPGAVQCAWALEQMMDELAEKIGMDPVEFRLRNVAGTALRSGSAYTSNGLRQCLTSGVNAFGWAQARKRGDEAGPIRRGVGMAVCRWVTDGGPPTTVIVSLLSDGSANLNLAAADQGTGTKTVMAMVVAEELGVPIDKVRVEQGDTGTTQFGKSGGGSHSVLVYAPAVRSAAMQVKTRLLELAAVEFGCATSELFLKDGSIIRKGGEAKRLSELKGLAEQEQITGMGQPPPEPSGKLVCSFGAQFAEVEVNMRTGEIRVLRLVAAHDSGRVMNRQTCESQVFGGMAMGIGFGLTEKRIMDEQTGRMVNANWHDYKIPTAKDVPFDQECLMIDPADSLCNSVGAKGLGEPTTVPTAPAIANAIAHATGFRFRQSPITPMQLIEARKLHEGG